jgi:hypothetical protein
MRRRRLERHGRIGISCREAVRRGRREGRYLGPKVVHDLRREEGRRAGRLAKFRIVEKKLEIGVRVGRRRSTLRSVSA